MTLSKTFKFFYNYKLFLYYWALKAKQITIRKIFSLFLFRGVGFACNLTFSRNRPEWDLKKKSTIWEHTAHGRLSFSGHLLWILYCLMPNIISAKWYKVGQVWFLLQQPQARQFLAPRIRLFTLQPWNYISCPIIVINPFLHRGSISSCLKLRTPIKSSIFNFYSCGL